jgi:hypothetical protein
MDSTLVWQTTEAPVLTALHREIVRGIVARLGLDCCAEIVSWAADLSR